MDSLDWLFVFIGACLFAVVALTILGGLRSWSVRKVGVATALPMLLAVAVLGWFLDLGPKWVFGSLAVTAGVIAAWGWGISRVERATRLLRESRDGTPTDQR
ncbi:MAG TPA: hypothetical protein VIL17_02445 [Coriobacteriia bacterium]